MPITRLERTTMLIGELEESLKNYMDEIHASDSSDPKLEYLKVEASRLNERLDFLRDYKNEMEASGLIWYEFDFGSVDDIRQKFNNTKFNDHYILEQMFTRITKEILERETTASRKVKMLNNLVTIFEEYKSKV